MKKVCFFCETCSLYPLSTVCSLYVNQINRNAMPLLAREQTLIEAGSYIILSFSIGCDRLLSA